MTAALPGTPAADGFFMPAEWAPHAGTWMIWPERPDNWRDNGGPGQANFVRLAEVISSFEPLTMVVSKAQEARARSMLPAAVSLLVAETNDAWCRDTGPTFVVNGKGEVRGVDWIFNAWGGEQGGLYAPWDADDRLAAAICAAAGVQRYRAPLVLEGGSIHVDGEGTLLTTEECLLNPNRNPHLSRAEIEAYMRDYLGISKVLWLDRGLFNDETDGHVDNIACFLRPGVVALTWCDDPKDPQYAISRDAEARLKSFTDAKGRALEVVRLPLPGPLFMNEREAAGLAPMTSGAAVREAGERLGASYANFYMGNGFVIVPQFGIDQDAEAIAILKREFPVHEVVGVATRDVLLGGGNVHCITQQQPAG